MEKWFLLTVCFVIIALVPNALAQDAAETASYQGVQPDEFMKAWLLLGPIPISDEPQPGEEAQKEAFAIDFLADQEGETGVQPKPGSTNEVGFREYIWHFVQSESDIVDLDEIFGMEEFAVAYAWAEIEVAEEEKVILGIGSDDGVKVWLNGELVHENWVGRAVTKDDDIVGVHLRKGKNSILLKVQNGIQAWGFSCRALEQETLAEKLILAVPTGDLEKMEMLLSHGVDVNAKDKTGLTALHAARIFGRTDVINFLLEKGADPNIEMPPKEKLIDNLFQEATEGDSAGAAVLIAKDGEILYQKAFGFANIEERIPVTPETKFRIGSITKQFTAAAILKLQEDGLLSVNDRLSKFIPDFPRGDEVTIHHLLTHTSGIHSFTSHPEFLKTVAEKVDPEDMVETIKQKDFDFDPGEKWLYNNSGYFILGYIVQKVSGESFGDYLKSHFFDPLEMNNTGIHSWDLNLENEAVGYSYGNGKYQKAMKWDMSRAGGAGALYSTVGDLYRWNEAIFNGQLLSESSLKAAFTPVKLNDGSEANALGAKYGYGWMLLEVRGLKEIQHGGGFDGFNAHLTRYPEHNFTVAVLTNCLPPRPPEEGSVGLVSAAGARAIAYIYLWDRMEAMPIYEEDMTVAKDVYDDYVGRYDYGTYGAILEVTREGDQLFAQMGSQPKVEIFPSSENEFFWKVVDAQITFVRNEEGQVTHAIHRQSGMEIRAPKVEEEAPAEVDPAIYDAYVGQYDFGRAVMTISKEGGQLFAQMAGQPRFEIFPRSETEFFWKVVNAQITFVKDENGEVHKALFRQGDVKMEVSKTE
jgi:CubicO group peptidase (beta-lactamase class C family)